MGKESYMKRIFIVVFYILTFLVACQKRDIYTIAEPYQYPIVPGMSEWSEFNSLQEMSEACQIPEDILPNMTTEALVETIMHYPLFINAFAYENPQLGLRHIKEYYNGLQELYKRDDAIEKLEEFIREKLTTLVDGKYRGMWAELILEDLLSE